VAEHGGAGETLVETAGGLLTPLGAAATNLDLAERLAPDAVVLVAADRLGALHDVRACLLALESRPPLAARTVVVLSAPPQADAATGSNAAELALLGWADAIVFPRAPLDDDATRAAAARLANALDSPSRPRSR